jgi:hypothetical protein
MQKGRNARLDPRAAPPRTIILGMRARRRATREGGAVRAVCTRARANQSALIRAFRRSGGARRVSGGCCGKIFLQGEFSRSPVPEPGEAARTQWRRTRFNAAAPSRHALQKGPFYRHFCAIGDFPQQILSSKIFAPEHWRSESTGQAVAPSAAAAIHKIKRNDCSFFATGVMRIAVQIDSRLHCSNVAIH